MPEGSFVNFIPVNNTAKRGLPNYNLVWKKYRYKMHVHLCNFGLICRFIDSGS